MTKEEQQLNGDEAMRRFGEIMTEKRLKEAEFRNEAHYQMAKALVEGKCSSNVLSYAEEIVKEHDLLAEI